MKITFSCTSMMTKLNSKGFCVNFLCEINTIPIWMLNDKRNVEFLFNGCLTAAKQYIPVITGQKYMVINKMESRLSLVCKVSEYSFKQYKKMFKKHKSPAICKFLYYFLKGTKTNLFQYILFTFYILSKYQENKS